MFPEKDTDGEKNRIMELYALAKKMLQSNRKTKAAFALGEVKEGERGWIFKDRIFSFDITRRAPGLHQEDGIPVKSSYRVQLVAGQRHASVLHTLYPWLGDIKKGTTSDIMGFFKDLCDLYGDSRSDKSVKKDGKRHQDQGSSADPSGTSWFTHGAASSASSPTDSGYSGGGGYFGGGGASGGWGSDSGGGSGGGGGHSGGDGGGGGGDGGGCITASPDVPGRSRRMVRLKSMRHAL